MMLFQRNPSLEEFEASALPHLDDLYRTAARAIGDRSEAEDLVQEAYLQAWKSFHRFQPGTNCRAWLFKILFHVIQHHRRRRYAMAIAGDSEQLLAESVVYEPPAPEHLTDEDMLAALERVPQQFREVILLADVQEFSYKEISGILQVPIGTVMSRLNRGRRVLRAEIESIARFRTADAQARGRSNAQSVARKSRTAGATFAAM
jgi:RNA polymerase sigma-70 factor (ECF subfamily)